MPGATGKAQLLCALAILAGLGAVLATTPGGPDHPAAEASAPAPELDPEAVARIAARAKPRVARRVAALRGLEFDDIPRAEVVDSEYLNRLSARDALRTHAYRSLAADEAALRMLGALAPDEQLESILGSTGELAAAAYDTRSDRLYIVSDAVTANLALVEFILAHELVHALEDQRFGLSEGERLDDDAATALVALHEGTATAGMIDYAVEHLSALELGAASAAMDVETGDVPEFYVEQVNWQYFGGARFVGALRELGDGWRLVDHALESRPPETTEQVLHVDKYLHAEQALEVEIATGELRAQGWRRAGHGVIGELSTRQLLGLGVEAAVARRAAAGWGGDVYELWRQDTAPADCPDPCREEFALVADWRMDSVAEAHELKAALAAYIRDGLGGEVNADVFRLDGGFAALRGDGDILALVLAPTATTARAVATEQLAP